MRVGLWGLAMVIISFKHHIFGDYAVEIYFVMNKGNNRGLLLINWTEPSRQYYMIFSLNKQISRRHRKNYNPSASVVIHVKSVCDSLVKKTLFGS